MPPTVDGIDRLQKKFVEYWLWLVTCAQKLVDRLAEEGVTAAQWYFDYAAYDGVNDVTVTQIPGGAMKAKVRADGNAVLFIEFGAGYLMGYGHPDPQGFGPGTYPGQTHAFDPNGWFLPKEAQIASGQKKSYGNPPAAAMYNTVKHLEGRIGELAREVFV